MSSTNNPTNHATVTIIVRASLTTTGALLKKTAQTKPDENEMGIDLDQLLFNLSLSHELRIAHHQAALDLIWELENARRINEAKSQ